jgi:hypothetical protein
LQLLPAAIPDAAVIVVPCRAAAALMAPMIVMVQAGHNERRRPDELTSIGRRAADANHSDAGQEK